MLLVGFSRDVSKNRSKVHRIPLHNFISITQPWAKLKSLYTAFSKRLSLPNSLYSKPCFRIFIWTLMFLQFPLYYSGNQWKLHNFFLQEKKVVIRCSMDSGYVWGEEQEIIMCLIMHQFRTFNSDPHQQTGEALVRHSR